MALCSIRSRGTVSASKDSRGEWTIDAAELFRHYEPVVHTNDATVHHGTQREVELLREMMGEKDAALRAAHDALRAAYDQIQDLRRRLDAESEERRRLTALLEALTPPQPQRHSWWARLLGSA